jgi:amino acid transporter
MPIFVHITLGSSNSQLILGHFRHFFQRLQVILPNEIVMLIRATSNPFAFCSGFNAGANLSGDLANPTRSIPLGTIIALSIVAGTYIVLGGVLAVSASPSTLQKLDPLGSGNNYVMLEVCISRACVRAFTHLGCLCVAPGLQIFAACMDRRHYHPVWSFLVKCRRRKPHPPDRCA